MNVLFLSPGYPLEMTWFAEGLAAVGANVFGVGEAPPATLDARCRSALTAYLQVPSLWNEESAVEAISAEAKSKGVRFDHVVSLWEPLMVLAAKLRAALGVDGMTVEQTIPFRDKETMKDVLDAAGIRTPRHARCNTATECREAAAEIGFPLIIKPVAGAGSADTHRCDDAEALEAALKVTGHVGEVCVEEFIDGREFTFDTICARGEIVYFNVCMYRPRPLIARTVEWVSPQTIALRDPHAPELASGVQMGHDVIKALGFTDGFTHMEWYLTDKGETVFGEIGARPPGARTVDVMNYASDCDLYKGWANAICHGSLGFDLDRRYNAASICKRAQGEGRIHRIDGMASLMARYGAHVAHIELLPVGAHRRNWLQTLLSDGHIIVRHPDLDSCLGIADTVGNDVRLYAG